MCFPGSDDLERLVEVSPTVLGLNENVMGLGYLWGGGDISLFSEMNSDEREGRGQKQ